MNELLIIFIVSMIISAIGFIMYVYFFSVGYGFSIAGIGVTMLILFRNQLKLCTVIMCVLFIIYGLRLGGYLLVRELKSTAYKSLLKNESKDHVPFGVKVCIWIACAVLYVCECAPVFFRMKNGGENDALAIIGIVLMAAGIVLEIVADYQKSAAKKIDSHMFVSTGVYKWVRCPNYFGELLLWTGAFVSGLNVLETPFQWVLVVLGYIGIIYVMFSGARRLELRQDKNYGEMEAYQEYVKTTPIIVPFLPIYSVKKHKWLVA
ncbi:MAG: DUF1295 domain-containing protein [Lachnospiraceae bacterium]|nr:DUF1295 domain-containing protein [Lachnospiraceae bacterium]